MGEPIESGYGRRRASLRKSRGWRSARRLKKGPGGDGEKDDGEKDERPPLSSEMKGKTGNGEEIKTKEGATSNRTREGIKGA